jgi:hypothetical protein
MMWLRPRLRQWVWLAMWALLGPLALPGLSQAFTASARSAGAADVCSTQGVRPAWPGAADAAPDEPAAVLHGLAHCPLCLHGVQPWVLPADAAADWPPDAVGAAAAPPVPPEPGPVAPPCGKALPRAPPPRA